MVQNAAKAKWGRHSRAEGAHKVPSNDDDDDDDPNGEENCSSRSVVLTPSAPKTCAISSARGNNQHRSALPSLCPKHQSRWPVPPDVRQSTSSTNRIRCATA